MDSGSKRGGRRLHSPILVVAASATLAATGCGEKSEPEVHPPTTVTPTVTTPAAPAPGTTATQPAPGATTPSAPSPAQP